MRKYESIVVFSPELNKGQLSEQISKVKEILTNAGGVQGDIYVEEWGKRKIAYTVKKQTMGYYVCFYYFQSVFSERLFSQLRYILLLFHQ